MTRSRSRNSIDSIAVLICRLAVMSASVQRIHRWHFDMKSVGHSEISWKTQSTYTGAQEDIQQRKRDELNSWKEGSKCHSLSVHIQREQRAAQHKPVALLPALCNSASALYSSRHTHTHRKREKLNSWENRAVDMYSRTDGRDACLPDRRVRRRVKKTIDTAKKKN